MGWGNCGTDGAGRPIGYIFSATCDHPDCEKVIHRGLSYVCGETHGADEISCEKYFCEDHLATYVYAPMIVPGDHASICGQCARELIKSGEWIENEIEGQIELKTEQQKRAE